MDMLTKPYDWQLMQWKSLIKQVSEKRLPHALLLAGAAGLGKTDFARVFANYLLCLQPQQSFACGICKSCELNKVNTHPDLKWVAPEEEGKQIKIADIREVGEFASQTAQQGGYRVVVIAPAEAMNISSANALLKNLEEPGQHTFFLLVCHALGRVPATIRSRCQKVVFNEPDVSTALNWLSSESIPVSQAEALLSLANGAPLGARSLFEMDALKLHDDMFTSLVALSVGRVSAVDVSKRWSDWDVPMLLTWLNQAISSRLKLLLEGNKLIQNNRLTELLQTITVVDPRLLYAYIDDINQARLASLSTANVNKQLLIEDLLIKWSALVKR
jgi:DNA polymerase-3 subunit delta'